MAQVAERTIAKRYRVQDQLGAGGMGTVYRGLDTLTGQVVAIKELKAKASQPGLLERFKREGEALRSLNHPNIVKLLEAIDEDGQHFLVTEFVPGGDLAQLLETSRLSIDEILRLGIDVADALTRAHRLKIFHRDLKPSNLLIAEDGTLRLTDFGVAYIGGQTRVTDPDGILGTLDYIAPEAFNGGTASASGDIWSFGVMLFEMLAGQRPFRADNVVGLITAIAISPLPDLEALCPLAPVTLIDLIYRMLERDPTERIASVRLVGLVLEDLLHVRESAKFASRFSANAEADTTPVNLFLRARHNLPAQPTQFVGRQAELAELDRLLQDTGARLVSILAPGGMGKTRLAIEAARRHRPAKPTPIISPSASTAMWRCWLHRLSSPA